MASRKGITDIQVKEGQTMVNSIVNVAERKSDIAPTPLALMAASISLYYLIEITPSA